MFVWARALCGLRISCIASVDCSGTIRKILEVEIEVGQGVANACYHDRFHDLGAIDKASGTVRSQEIRVDAQCGAKHSRLTRPGPLRAPGSALTRNVARRTCFREEYYTGMRRYY